MTFDGGQDEQNLQDASEPGEPRPASCPSCYPVQIQGPLILCSAGVHGCLTGIRLLSPLEAATRHRRQRGFGSGARV